MTTSVAELEAGKTTIAGSNNCTVVVDNFVCRVKPSFIDYLRSGWEVSLTCAIDYTASNGNQSSPSSLHAMGPNNQYERAIYSVGQIVEPYDADRSFPTFGFGGVPRHMNVGSVSHCFPLSGNAADPNIVGIDGIINVYR